MHPTTKVEFADETDESSDKETIVMHREFDVSDMPDEDVKILRQLKRYYGGAFEEVVEKNRDYSFSFLTTGKKLADSFIEYDAEAMQVLGLLTRSGDKRERFVENVFGNGDSNVSDEPNVTAMECANYWMFLALITSEFSDTGNYGDNE